LKGEREREDKVRYGRDIKVGQSEGRKRGGKDRWGAEREGHRGDRHLDYGDIDKVQNRK
jgi:hypothetical protein